MRFFMLLFVLFLSFLASSAHSSQSRDFHLRRQASILVSLKRSFQYEPTDPFLTQWSLRNYKSVCSWSGVQCDRSNTSVVSLDVSNTNISGTLSPAITALVSLVSLSVSGNDLSGTFPNQIHKLSELRFLNISNNQFQGSLDWEFSRLRQLQVLDAYNNNFNGSLPSGVTQLPKLNHLDFGGNYFSGSIPPSYGDMIQLNHLSLAGNDLGGSIPAELGKLTSLKKLYLGYFNQFRGGVPPELGNLVNLTHLDMASCGLDGPIPREVGSLYQLDTLFLQTNQLSGSVPPQLGNLTSLRSLDLSNNALTGEIPVQFSALRNLTLLNLFINRFHGEIPPVIAELPNLQVLKLWQNNFTGAIPETLGRNGQLVDIDLSTNKLTGLIPKSLCFGRNLRILILLNNFLFGPLPDDLGKCDTLFRVRLGQNYLTGSIPKGFLSLPELSLVELQNNYLTGPLPETTRIGSKSKLGQLNLCNNRLSGSLPSMIGNLSSLKILLLSGNRFQGQITSEIGNLKSVLRIDLSRNNLSGPIPPQIGECPQLTYLDLSQNQLSGPIPVEITQVHNLNYLNVSWNNLNQSLIKEIGSMKSLTSADFSHNNLSGSIPGTGQYLFFNSTAFIGNPNLCGSYSNPCNYSSTSAQTHNQDDTKPRVPNKYKLVFALGLLACSLIFVVFAVMKARKVRRGSNSWTLTAFQKLEFGSEDILECVKDNNVIGRGGAGIVFRGTMPNGEEVAVKKLLGIGKGSSARDNGLSAEVQTLGRIRHRNIVRLMAFCSNKETNLLVYEYMPNGSLGEVLHGKRGGHLEWDTRLTIAIEAAKGLCYLHHDCSPLILHRDVKSNNILLNSDFEAHVADFGLAKFLQDTDASQCMSAIAGSYGYIAPEYAYTLKVDEKSDVYSFGVVLLELITGRRPVGGFGEEGLDIVQWSKMKTDCSKDGAVKILDERLNSIPLEQAKQVFFVAMLCVQEQSVERPTMREVVQMLAQAKQPHTFNMQ